MTIDRVVDDGSQNEKSPKAAGVRTLHTVTVKVFLSTANDHATYVSHKGEGEEKTSVLVDKL